MRAVQFDLTIPKYVWTKAMGKVHPSLYVHGPKTCVDIKTVPKPTLPADDWVEISVTYGGICGSDLHLVSLRDSPATSPFVSFPFTIGHEMVGTVTKIGPGVRRDLFVGDRVVIDPILSCETRAITSPCHSCADGNFNLCHHMTSGSLSPGLLTGACKDTGGSWGEYLVAHESQVIVLPDTVDDKNGVLVEPFTCALHTVLQNKPKRTDTVFVIGAGVIGICLVAAIKALHLKCKIVVLVKYPFQAELAITYGADDVVYLTKNEDYVYDAVKLLKAKALKPIIGEAVVDGGADIVFECVGSKKSLQDSLRFARKGGTVALLGLANVIDQLDLTMVWLNELIIKGSFAYGSDNYLGETKRTMQIAVDLLSERQIDLSPLITHTFPLVRYREAIAIASNKTKDHSIKVVLTP
ncbi:zinc-dependent alcohol dehydrogenase [Salipaludibacillus daqingensis]|uniref:zinc-dependent alcohol dehydrogenase n=1 Tax=Salipaludibacillus daqingensis TaxID=3041001 RepID=UPI002476B759|nr:zinc-binding dehydrogenase [Salipaludibacillus daqingensis]